MLSSIRNADSLFRGFHMDTATVTIDFDTLVNFTRDVFIALGLTEDDAVCAADVLVTADLRGIPSHGIARLWRYVNGLKSGLMLTDAPVKRLRETPSSLVIDAAGGMGAPVSVNAMKSIISKARDTGAAFGSVRESNHFGIASYYAMMALEHDMIGIAMTNTAALGVPTFGRQVMFGTNPLAFAAPADKERAFVLDMSTTVVTRGKVEVYDRLEKDLPAGWAVDKSGKTAKDPSSLLVDMFNRIGGGILPLGGEGENFGGHKGYGLAVMVDILCSLLSGQAFGPGLCDTETSSARVGHFFGAIRIDMFRDPADFKHDMDNMLEGLRNCPVAEGGERVWFAGQKEFEQEDYHRKNGIPLLKKTYEQLKEIGGEFRIAL